MDVKRIFRGPWLWIVLAVVGVLVALQYLGPSGGDEEVDTSTMVGHIEDGSVESILIVDGDQEIQVTLDDGTKLTASWVAGQQVSLVNKVQEQVDAGTIEKYNVEVPRPSLLGSILVTLLPFVLIILLFLFLMNQMQGGGCRVMQFGKSKAKLVTKDTPKTTFADVAGCDEAIEELEEIKEFLQEPAKFQAVGAKIPKGVLLYGPPGTGKTLLARAVAGEAGVPFYSISGSDFVEMFVGVGASRVRDLFEQAKENAPAIVFIDEIDAVGRHRGAGMGGGHDEREQTLNQLLVEMDGFDVQRRRHPDRRDQPARHPRPRAAAAGPVRPPDRRRRARPRGAARRSSRCTPRASRSPRTSTSPAVARRTPGFTGADLANVLNEAALLTARQNSKLIDNECPRRGDRPRRRRPAEAHPADERQGEEDHRLPRGRPRPGRRGAARHRPGAQGHDPAARPRPRLHDGAAGRGQVLPDPRGDARPARLHAGRPGGRGAGLPRPDHRRRQRHREGHGAGPRRWSPSTA